MKCLFPNCNKAAQNQTYCPKHIGVPLPDTKVDKDMPVSKEDLDRMYDDGSPINNRVEKDLDETKDRIENDEIVDEDDGSTETFF